MNEQRTSLLLGYLFVVALAALLMNMGLAPRVEPTPYSHFRELLDAGHVREASIGATTIRFTVDPATPLADAEPVPALPFGRRHDAVTDASPTTLETTRVPGLADEALLERLVAKGVVVTGRIESTLWRDLLLTWILPIAALLLLWTVMAGRIARGIGSPLTLGKNRAHIYSERDIAVRFDDVAGIEEAKAELQEIVDFLQNPDHYRRLGGQIPKGVLLVGPPGTGKTLLARAIAGESGVPFFSISGSEFVEMFVGVGAARVRDLFDQAKTKAPCIIFVDELDAVGKTRSGAPRGIGRHEEQEQTLNQLLVEMDGFDSSKGVILLAATNRPEVLDPALLRAGRFDRRIAIELPDVRGRTKILQVHLKKIRIGPDLDVERLAARTPGFSGADLANLVNEGALLAARRHKEQVDHADFEEAADRLTAGIERRSRVLSEVERDIVAHHEAGHALVAALVPHADPVHKVTIIPRAMGSLGFTMQLPLEDRLLRTKPELDDRLAVLLGGLAAEELVYGVTSSGVHNDLAEATRIARAMVSELGMSERLGPVSITGSGDGGTRGAPDFLGHAGAPIGDATADLVDAEVKALVAGARDRARALLHDHRSGLELLARAVREHETLEGLALRHALADATSNARRHADHATTPPAPRPIAAEHTEDLHDRKPAGRGTTTTRAAS